MRVKYRARDASGHLVTGYLEGQNIQAIVTELSGNDDYLIELKEVARKKQHMNKFVFPASRVKLSELATMSRQFALMLDAGLPILECLNVIQAQCSNNRLRITIGIIIPDIKQGLSLYECVAKHPKIFSDLYLAMIRAGEVAGTLSPILYQLSSYLEKESATNKKIAQALIYPVFIIVVTVVTILMIITFVFPRIVSIFETSGMPLPLPTKLLLIAGIFMKKWGWLVLPGIAVTCGVLRLLSRQPNIRFHLELLGAKIPVWGRVFNQIAVARFARSIGALLRSGISILQALEVVRDSTGSLIVGQAIDSAGNSLRNGEKIVKPFEASNVFEPIVTQMIAVGEETGRLDDMMIHLSDYYENETVLMVDSMLKLIEPILITITAMLVGFVIIAMLLPMLSMVSMVTM